MDAIIIIHLLGYYYKQQQFLVIKTNRTNNEMNDFFHIAFDTHGRWGVSLYYKRLQIVHDIQQSSIR